MAGSRKPLNKHIRFPLAAGSAATTGKPTAGANPKPEADADADAPRDARGRLYGTIIRFVTDNDFPPFNYLDDEGTLTGFNVDIARSICLELDVSCDVQARNWKDLVPALKRGETDAVIASLAITPRALAEVDFTDRYYFSPGRFAARKGTHPKIEVSPVGLESKRVGVLKGTAHEAYLKAFFRDCLVQPFDQAELTYDALQAGKIDFVFGDVTNTAFWLNGANSKGCCELRGGSFFDPAYFGDGLGVAIRKGDIELKRLINTAVRKLRENGQYQEILKRHFPAGAMAELEKP
jgi:polar amino acid transport system substrate-binding protein